MVSTRQQQIASFQPVALDIALTTAPLENSVFPQVGLITIWYRATVADMDRFIASLRAQTYPRILPVFIIHDQRSEDVERLRREVSQAQIIDVGENLGTAAGWNLGIRYLLIEGADYIGIWNVDVRYDPECVTRLVVALECDQTIGAVAPLLFYSDAPGTVQMYGGSLDIRTGLGSHDYRGATNLAALPVMRDAGYLDGGTMLLRTDLLRRVGGFDEAFFLYCEDSDLSLRARQAGYRTVALRDAFAWHYHRENKGRIAPPYEVFYITRNHLYLVRKYSGERWWFRAVLRALGLLPRRLIFYLYRGKLTHARAYFYGIRCGITARMGNRGWVA